MSFSGGGRVVRCDPSDQPWRDTCYCRRRGGRTALRTRGVEPLIHPLPRCCDIGIKFGLRVPQDSLIANKIAHDLHREGIAWVKPERLLEVGQPLIQDRGILRTESLPYRIL